MRRLLLTLLVILIAVSAYGFDFWNDIRHTAPLPDDTVLVRMENPSGAGQENYVLYDDGAAVVEGLMSSEADGPSTLKAIVPGPVAAPRYYGFRYVNGADFDLMPVRIANGLSPTPDDLTHVATDPEGDDLYGLPNLDLVAYSISFSDTEIFASLTNAGGGFPVSQLLTFYGYLLAIADPSQPEPDPVFGLMYTYEQAGIVSPGLYKILGTGLGDLVKLGEVSIQEYPASNTLMISCQLADLMADPDFMSWYDPSDPVLGIAAFTQRITLLGGAVEADRTPGGGCSLREFSISPGANTLPNLANHAFTGSGPTAAAQIDYTDADGNCPILSEIVFDGTETYDLRPQTLDYTAPVTYVTDAGIPPLADDTWMTALFRFSDDLTNTVEQQVPETGIEDEPVSRLALHVSPNPTTTSTRIALTLPAPGPAQIAVYDARGALVRTLAARELDARTTELMWDGRNDAGLPAASGVYFVRAATRSAVALSKVALLR